MTRIIAHRGPDDEGLTLILPDASTAIDLTTSDTVAGVAVQRSIAEVNEFPHRIAFGHRRFSIVDISPAGHQPFWSADRQVCVCFNGEIYNYVELRQELKALGHVFHTSCDTEVLAEAYLEWGVQCFQHFNGFWALSLYDAKTRQLLLARDRVGVAPLYIARTANALVWSSEIKAILTMTGNAAFAISDQAVVNFIQHSWRDVFHHTFYEGITTLPNATYAWIESDGSYTCHKYWQLPTQRLSERSLNFAEASQTFRELLTDAVRVRLRADVPVGVELSGGMDSSSLVGVAAQMAAPMNVFTVSFPNTAVDEEPYARKVVERYSDLIEYTVITPPPDEFFDRADSYIGLMEEPFHAPNVLTNQQVWQKMAQAGIRVSINGAAGDEVLAGYSHYYEPYLRHLLSQQRWSDVAREFFQFSEHPPDRLAYSYLRTAYRLLPASLKILRNPARTIDSKIDPFATPSGTQPLTGISSEIHQLMLDYMGDWQMNYWMRAGNKSAMGVPLETRCPFLDYRLLDFAFTLPMSYLIHNGWLKWILRDAVKDILPPEVVWRKVKLGFPFPLVDWLVASHDRFFAVVGHLDCPYLDLPLLKTAYWELSQRHPAYLWRLMSLALWWKKCVQGESLV